ncbi:decaprenyl-phosphate phosphoribosyltransferase [Candidatus Woesebacteria bacterium]|nr:decaprenyl-phosphate phosphoribosyltransferase [Candidatus Woesebacteria bacterium]
MNSTQSFGKTTYLIIKTARPRQWIKNLSLYAALVFSGFFFYDPIDSYPYVVVVTYAFAVFSLLTSGIYFVNDIIDREADQKHPFKKKRPIPSGELSLATAKITSVLLLCSAMLLSIPLSLFFKLLAVGYLTLQLLYSKKLKHIPILDVSAIAAGFLIRIYAGAVVVNLHMSVWFLLTVLSASLFLAVGKRQSERTLLKGREDAELGSTRTILKRYSQRLLDQYTGMFANSTWLSYALFAFQNEVSKPDERIATIYTILPKALHSQKLLMLSIPFVIIGVMRYLQLVYESNQGESPERVLLNDKPLLVTVFLFGLVVMTVLYVLT